MKWLAGVAAVVLAVVLLNVTRGPDLECPGGAVGSSGPLYDATYPGERTAREAVGDRFPGSDHVTEKRDDVEGIETATFRAYDADDKLLGLVVAERRASGGWYLGRSATCD